MVGRNLLGVVDDMPLIPRASCGVCTLVVEVAVREGGVAVAAARRQRVEVSLEKANMMTVSFDLSYSNTVSVSVVEAGGQGNNFGRESIGL